MAARKITVAQHPLTNREWLSIVLYSTRGRFRRLGGLSMSEENIALLRSLVLRPSLQLAPALQPMVDALVEAGYVTRDSSGWTATAEGCNLIEREPTTIAQRGLLSSARARR
jgi:hypothetical protein